MRPVVNRVVEVRVGKVSKVRISKTGVGVFSIDVEE